MTQSRLRFMHIPKAGGTTLNAILARQYHPRQTFTFSGEVQADIERYDSLSQPARDAIVLFIGHAPLLSGLADADEATTITMLRHPVSRVKSFCQHVAEGKSPYLLHEFPPDSFDLDRFLRSGDGHLSNQQTKILINQGDVGLPGLLDVLSPSEARDRALENLFSRVRLIGIQESFDDSVRLFADDLGWSLPWYFSKNQRSSARQLVFEPRHIEMITELNSIDLEVYATAREHFEAMVETRGITSAAFSRTNRLLSPLMATWDDLYLRYLYWSKRLSGQLDE